MGSAVLNPKFNPEAKTMSRTTSDYRKTVTAIAEEALEEYPGAPNDSNEDERRDYVSQSVDGSEYVIYYSANEIVLEAT